MIENFRFWDPFNKRMTYLSDCGGYLDVFFASYEQAKKLGWKPVLMHSTGMEDRKEEMIFEGDVLKLGDRCIAIVCRNSKTAAYACRTPWDPDPYCDHLAGASSCEIIGTMYENPELLVRAPGQQVPK